MGLVDETFLPVLLAHWPLALLAGAVVFFVRNYFYNGLNQYPGPAAAGFTNWWRFVDVARRRPQVTLARLHARHGDVVRIGPDVLSFADPRAIKDIYGLNKGFVKAMVNGQRLPSLFSTTDEHYHAQLRRCVNSAFAMSTLVQYEPGCDEVTQLFLERTEQLYAATGRTCEFLTWLQFYAFDVIGQVTYSKSHGFVERDEDVDGVVQSLRNTFDYVAWAGQIPLLDLCLAKNPVRRALGMLGLASATTPVAQFAIDRMAERRQRAQGDEVLQQQQKKKKASDSESDRSDLLAKFLQAKADHPDFFHDRRVLTMAVSMAFAGSETTSISLAAVFYYLLRTPRVYKRMMDELTGALADGRLGEQMTAPGGTGVVTWAEAQTLPYLDACIREAFRLHPAVGLLLERVVPPGGADIAGRRVPGGTIVGCNAWVLHRRPDIFGADAEAYRPERWLLNTDNTDSNNNNSSNNNEAALAEMNRCMFHFGAGARTCIGRNISLLEMYKLVPSLLLRFDISLADPTKDWRPFNAWFVRQKDFYTRFAVRKPPSEEAKA